MRRAGIALAVLAALAGQVAIAVHARPDGEPRRPAAEAPALDPGKGAQGPPGPKGATGSDGR